MAITISGENNNDRIVAADGVIDSISGFNISGIITASSFTGDLTGDVTGNLTGNVTGNINNSTLLLQTGGTERVRITSTGNVGINETTPEAKFEVDGRIRVLDNNDATPSTGKGLEISYFNTADYADILSYDRGGSAYKDLYLRGNNLVFKTGTSERVRITSTGDIQVDNGNLHIDDNGEFAIFEQDTSLAMTNSSKISMDFASNVARIRSSHNGSGGNAVSRPLAFFIGSSEKLRIASGGFIGAGTQNPRRHLHIHNSATATVGFQMTNGGTGESNDSQGFQLKVGSDGHAEIAQMENSNLRIFTDGDERIRIDKDGNVNIGGDYTSTTSRIRINSTSYPETTEYLAVFKAGVANGNRFKNRYIKIRNNYTGSGHGGVPIVWEANADGSNNKAYGAVVTEYDGDIRFLNAAATSEKAIGTDLLSTISEKFRINTDGTSLFTGNEVKIYNATNNSNTYFYAQNTGAGNAGIRMRNGSGDWTIIANDSLRFRDEDGSTDRLNITSNGDVGIGTVTPTNSTGYKTLSIKGGIGGQIELTGDSVKNYIWTNTSAMNIAAGYQGGSGYQLKVYTDGGSTSTERVRIGDGYVSILDDTAAYYKPALNIKNTAHSAYGGAIIFTGEVSNGTEFTQARIRTFGGTGAGDGSLAIEAGDLNEVARFKSGYMTIGGVNPNISAAKGIEITNAATTEIRLKNSNGGTGSSDGFAIQKWNNDTSYIYEYDQSDIVFGVSSQSKVKLHKQGRLTLAPSGNTNGGNTGYALSIVQDGNYAYNGSATGTYPGIHIKSTSTGGGNGASIFTPDASWSLYNQSGQTGLAIAPSTTGAASDKVRFFVMQNGQVALGVNTFARIDQAHYNDAQLTVAGGGINIVPITSGTSSPQVRHTVSWYHAGPNSSYSYQHLVTDVWGGANPTGNTEYIMGGFTIKGYRYSPGGCSNEDIFFHNWGGGMHGYSRSHRGTWDPGNAAYIHSTGYVALRLLTGTYQVYDIDLYQFAVYTARDFNVTTVTYSNNTTE